MINIETHAAYGIPLFRLGFRPFFLAAGIYAVLSVLIWMFVYIFGTEYSFSGIAPTTWHAHEMIFGYAVAVIAGFLLTAIKNWTGQQTLRGKGLAVLFSLWLLARVLPLSGLNVPINVIAVFDLLFMFFLVVAAALPVIKVRQYKQLGVISKLLLLLLSNALFYLGVSGIVEEGVRWGLYSGMYMIIALVFVMGRRVIPFFIEKGIDSQAEIKNWLWLDISSLLLLIVLWIMDVFTRFETATSVVAGLLVILHVIRLHGWHTVQIWNKPLLWVLYLAYSFIVFGFALKASVSWLNTPPALYVHAFTYGGIGVMTMGMMARVILGHTGRNVFEPPKILSSCFMLLLLGAIFRVVLPLITMEFYSYWIGISQLLWIAAFTLFLIIYAPMLVTPRIDGRDG